MRALRRRPASRHSGAGPSAISSPPKAAPTAETLAKNGCPVRTIKLDRLDEASLGELLMHFMLETIIAAQLLGIDAFDQPAVEEGKVLAKRYLTGGA
jgi:glucose-6-phosphate isomerase